MGSLAGVVIRRTDPATRQRGVRAAALLIIIAMFNFRVAFLLDKWCLRQ